ncbi:MAG TPA: formyltransferase family protein [Thermoguttaceae bacterium]|nr:formyltransferase family protein [Thermoguttaceae bacterium]
MHKIVLCGIQQQGKDIITFLNQRGIQVTNIVTISRETAVKNRSETTWVSYEDISDRLGIPIHYANTYGLTHREDVEYFAHHKFDLLLLGGWQRLFSDEILRTVTFSIGQHGSPEHLPKGRGRSPLNWAIIQGKKRLIWNLFLLDKGVDSGDVIDYQIFEINPFDDCKTVYYKVSTSVKHMLARSIPKLLEGQLTPVKQIGEPSYHEKRTPEDGRIDWNMGIVDVCNLIRGVTRPYPGAFTAFQGERIPIWRAQAWDTIIDFYQHSGYGEIVEVFEDAFVVKCYDGLLLVTDHDDKNVFVGKRYETGC